MTEILLGVFILGVCFWGAVGIIYTIVFLSGFRLWTIVVGGFMFCVIILVAQLIGSYVL